ncbi:MAG: hypothetical protein PHF72_15270, partial [Gammaproteobacteria bacterium]|nr:hypothetical protein [Gammaproteobacteria bacterium]
MADLFTVTAPLGIRLPDGDRAVIAECFRHPRGLLWFETGWHRGDPDRTIHLAEGEVRGEGPWRIGDHIVQVLGCQGSDPELAAAHSRWRMEIEHGGDYPPPPLVAAIARRRGALTDDDRS